MSISTLRVPSPLSVPGYNLVGGLAFTGVDGHPRRAEQADLDNWDPRAGFAYRIAERTVLRGGFGIFHNPLISPDRDITQGFSSRHFQPRSTSGRRHPDV